MLDLRDYQVDCLDALTDCTTRGVKRMLVAMPTGSGKTVIFSQLPGRIKDGRRMLVIAHREELLDQAAEKILWANSELAVEIEQAERHASLIAQVVVASIQTLSVSPKRLAALDPRDFAIIIIDEAHHVPATTYLRLLHRFHLGPDPEQPGETKRQRQKAFKSFVPKTSAPTLIGFTATPNRTDNIGLGAVFDEIAYSRSMEEMMRAGWLCKIIGKRIQTLIDISGVKMSHGDFQEGQLSRIVGVKERNELAVKSYLGLAAGRSCLVFCVNVEHTENMARAFQEMGIAARYVVGSTPKEERDSIINDYRAGRVPVLVNCMVLTEGFDAPGTSCIIMARPTKSQLLYEQMMGRGTRIAPGKDNLLVIDLVDAGAKGVADVNTLFGLPPALDWTGADVLEAKDELDRLDMLDMIPEEVLTNALTIEAVRQLARDFNPLGRTKMPLDLKHTLSWVKTNYGYGLSIVGGGQVKISLNLLGHATVHIKESSDPWFNQLISVGVYPTVQMAIDNAERYVREKFPNVMHIMDRTAPWHVSKDLATEKQVALLNKLQIRVPGGLTKGQASDLISQALAHRGRR